MTGIAATHHWVSPSKNEYDVAIEWENGDVARVVVVKAYQAVGVGNAPGATLGADLGSLRPLSRQGA